MYLMTYWGTFVAYNAHTDRFYQTDYTDRTWHEVLVDFAIPDDFKTATFLEFIENEPCPPAEIVIMGPDGHHITISAGVMTGSVALARNGLYLCASHEYVDMSFQSGAPNLWENFVLVSQREVDRLKDILNRDWVIQ